MRHPWLWLWPLKESSSEAVRNGKSKRVRWLGIILYSIRAMHNYCRSKVKQRINVFQIQKYPGCDWHDFRDIDPCSLSSARSAIQTSWPLRQKNTNCTGACICKLLTKETNALGSLGESERVVIPCRTCVPTNMGFPVLFELSNQRVRYVHSTMNLICPLFRRVANGTNGACRSQTSSLPPEEKAAWWKKASRHWVFSAKNRGLMEVGCFKTNVCNMVESSQSSEPKGRACDNAKNTQVSMPLNVHLIPPPSIPLKRQSGITTLSSHRYYSRAAQQCDLLHSTVIAKSLSSKRTCA